jgi:two-component sensor histidine kinase
MAAQTPDESRGAALSLTLAVIESSNQPLLLLDGELNVIAASTSFFRAFDVEPAGVPGRPVFDIGAGEWNVPQFRSLLAATASGDVDIDAYEMDLRQAGAEPRRLVLHAHKLSYDDATRVRLLLSVSDVTKARAGERQRDDMLREKAILLQELQHRVANSLQIIASVLMQSARTVQSEESRGHLQDAHQRVMSVAALQQQLAASTLSDVELRPYFTRLCASIGASMIRDRDQLSLEVIADDSTVDPDASVSLGLIVTELVINSLKHAFPDRRGGRILVGYEAHGPNWTLSVKDDGVGMPTGDAAGSGLGTSIVQALAKQLKANVRVTEGHPGTTVAIVHTQIAAVDDTGQARPAL